MVVRPLGVQSDSRSAIAALEIVDASDSATCRPEVCRHFVLNPANGALEISPALRNKALKALEREVRRMKLRLYVTFARLYLRKFVLQCSYATARVRRDFLGVLGQLARV
jgi:hypothetical protein